MGSARDLPSVTTTRSIRLWRMGVHGTAIVMLFISAVACGDDRGKLVALLERGGVVTVPPGDYYLDGAEPIPLVSDTTITAYGARFILPKDIPAEARIVLFAGENVSHFTWFGGEFRGHVFDPALRENAWEPQANTKGIEITTTREGGTHDVIFRDIQADGIAGAVIGVHGLYDASNERDVTIWAQRVAIDHCTLLRSGKFMWDYGYLWQIMTYPEAYKQWEVDRARKYFRSDLMRQVSMTAGSEQVRFDNTANPIPVSATIEPHDAVTFMGSQLPTNLVRGRQYFVTESASDFIKVADQPHGPAITFKDDGSGQLVHDLHAAYLAAYAPTLSGPGKGAFDLVGVKGVHVTGCQLSALGDTMHIQRCSDIIFAHNHILGSRMGAFFLAEYCRTATVVGNIVDGTNGSRVMSVEKSCQDVTITGNTFRGGGRGAWINQPVNFVMTNNVFVNNTTKNDPALTTGRIAFQTAQPGQFPELYFTLYQQDGTYGPVIVRNNVFQLGEHCPDEAVTFAPHGHDIVFSDNVFRNKPATIVVDPTCTTVAVEKNVGAITVSRPVDFHHGHR